MRKPMQIVFCAAALFAVLGVTSALAQPGLLPAGVTNVVRLAERGDPRAQTRLGFMLETGRGAPQNFGEAAYWYLRAAEQGDADAQYFIGNCFALGLGVPVNPLQAHVWFNLSASRTRQDDERQHRIHLRDAVATRLSRSALDEAQQLAIEWRPKPERRYARN
jgi:TPR repeat protein